MLRLFLFISIAVSVSYAGKLHCGKNYYPDLLYKGTHNLTASRQESGSVKFSWIEIKTANLYCIVCTPAINYEEEVMYFTTTTSLTVSGFEDETGYECSLLAVYNDGSEKEEKIKIHSLGNLRLTLESAIMCKLCHRRTVNHFCG